MEDYLGGNSEKGGVKESMMGVNMTEAHCVYVCVCVCVCVCVKIP
jgi:hypothetical protein